MGASKNVAEEAPPDLHALKARMQIPPAVRDHLCRSVAWDPHLEWHPQDVATTGLDRMWVADVLISEFEKFLVLKVMVKDWDATQRTPSRLVDMVWHKFIQHPRAYGAHCITLCGQLLWPYAAGEAHLIRTRYRNTLIAYFDTFQVLPLAPFWDPLELVANDVRPRKRHFFVPTFEPPPPIPTPPPEIEAPKEPAPPPKDEGTFKITVRYPRGDTNNYEVGPSSLIDDLKIAVARKTGVPPIEQRLILSGKHMEGHKTVAECHVPPHATLDLVLKRDVNVAPLV